MYILLNYNNYKTRFTIIKRLKNWKEIIPKV